MLYRFRCLECDCEENKEIPIAEYDKKKKEQVCSNCGGDMERVIEWTGIAKGEGQGWCGNSRGNVI